MTDITQLRQEILHCDTQIIAHLAKRLRLCQKIGTIKNRTGQTISDPEREAFLMAHYAAQCQIYGLDFTRIQPILLRIIAYSKALQANG